VLTGDGVEVLGAADGAPLDFIPVGGLNLEPPNLKLLYNPANNKLYLAFGGEDLRIIDPGTHAVSSVTLALADWAALDTGNNNVITVFNSPPTLCVVSGETDTLLGTVPLTGSLLGSSNNLAVDPVSHYAYVLTTTGTPAGDFIDVVDTVAGTPVDSFPTTLYPTGITLDPARHILYVLSDSQPFVALDSLTGEPVGSFTSGNLGSVVSAVGDPADNRIYWYDFNLSGYNGYYVLRMLDAGTGTADEVIPGVTLLANEGYAGLAFTRRQICELPCPGIFVAGIQSGRLAMTGVSTDDDIAFASVHIDLGSNVTALSDTHFQVNTAGVYEIGVSIAVSREVAGDYNFAYSIVINDNTNTSPYFRVWDRIENQTMMNDNAQVFQQLRAGDVISARILNYTSDNKAADYLGASIAIRKIC